MNTDGLKQNFNSILKQLARFRIIIFLVGLALVYAFIIMRINALGDPAPSLNQPDDTIKQTSHVDQSAIDKIKQLKDNSVNVQTLFNEARQNPFQE
jgi:hypothetical protein